MRGVHSYEVAGKSVKLSGAWFQAAETSLKLMKAAEGQLNET